MNDLNFYEKLVRSEAEKYYTTGTQNLSDTAFDAIVDKIKELNPNSDVLTTGWGYKVNSDNKIKHKYGHVGSLEKVRTWEETVARIPEIESSAIDISAKLDGMSVVLYYTNGNLNTAVTRGDGEFGIDITEKMYFLIGKSIPDNTFTGAVRGEIKMCPDDFKKFQKIHPEAKNHRNSAVGLINGDDITSDFKFLKFFAYSVVGQETEKKFTTLSEVYTWLKNNFKYTAPRIFTVFSKLSFQDSLKFLKQDWERSVSIDGIVISSNNLTTNGNELIQKSVAFKFPEEEKVTTIQDIEWTMSKNNNYIPVAIIDPIVLAGTTVKRVTAFNAKYVKENQLGKGAIVTVSKRGEIIPDIQMVLKSANNFELPKLCPHCNTPLVWDSVHLTCANKNCQNTQKEDIKAWCMNLAPIDGLGWKTIDKFLANTDEFDYQISSLYQIMITVKVKENSELGMFKRMLTKLHTGPFTISQFLLALNIPGLGKISAKRFEAAGNAKEIIDKIINKDNSCYQELCNILQDSTVAILLYKRYYDKFVKFYNIVRDKLIFNTTEEVKEQGQVVITGTLSMKRSDFEKLLNEKGWKLSSTVNKNTKYLITNTPESDTTKNKAADKLGVTKITENDFINKFLEV